MNTSSDIGLNMERRFMRSAMKAPLLEADHEHDLARRWREEQDEAALHELTTAYLRLVISMATKFRKYGLPMSDLVQEGNIGLMQAAARFEPDREVRFSTYANWWVRAAIQDYVLRNWSIVRTGTTAAQKSLFFNLRRLRARINDMDDDGMTPETRQWIAQQLNVREADVETMTARLSAGDKSLNAPVGAEGEGEFQDILPGDSETPEHIVMTEHDTETRRRWIRRAMKVLNPREARIILERQLSDDTKTLETLGQQLGISKERVRQIEQAALKKLKKALVSLAGSEDELSALI